MESKYKVLIIDDHDNQSSIHVNAESPYEAYMLATVQLDKTGMNHYEIDDVWVD